MNEVRPLSILLYRDYKVNVNTFDVLKKFKLGSPPCTDEIDNSWRLYKSKIRLVEGGWWLDVKWEIELFYLPAENTVWQKK